MLFETREEDSSPIWEDNRGMADPQAQDPQTHGYVAITILKGQISNIEPKRADTESAMEAKTGGIAGALNELAEYRFRLLDGSTPFPVQTHGANEGVLFMYRKR
jgi:hypothetical protein